MVSYNIPQPAEYRTMRTNTHTGIILRTGINASPQSEQWVGYDKEKDKEGKEKIKK
jgi:hypothetical protein